MEKLLFLPTADFWQWRLNPEARKKPELFSVSLWKKEQGECILLSRNTGRITPTVENYPEKRNVHHAEKN